MPLIKSLLFFLAFASCNVRTSSAIYKDDFNLKSDLLIIQKPTYNYIEFVNYEPHDPKKWMFAKDTPIFYSSFNEELVKYFKDKENVRFSGEKILSKQQEDSCFRLLQRNSKDSFHLFIESIFPIQSTNIPIGVLRVEFVMSKETGTSGLGPMGNFTPLGAYYISFFAVKKNKLVFYNSERWAAIINGMFTSKRSRNAIKGFFRRI